MALVHGKRKVTVEPSQGNQPSDVVRQFLERLTPEQRLLIILKRELYEGNWDGMLSDLQARLEGRPYVFKLVHRISDDIRRIEQLRAFEQQHQVDLADYVSLDTPAA